MAGAMRRTRLAAGAASVLLAGALTGPWSGLPAQAGDAAQDGVAPEAGGSLVTGGSGADDAAPIDPGAYADTLTHTDVPVGQRHPARTYRIDLHEGQAGYIAASLLRPAAAGGPSAGGSSAGVMSLSVTIASPADPSCTVTRTEVASAAGTGPVSASAGTGVIDATNANGSCFHQAGSFLVSVSWPDTLPGLPDTLPLELRFVRQDAAAWSQIPNPSADPPAVPFMSEPQTEASRARSAASPNTAPRLRGPAAEVEVPVGAVRFVRVPVAAGQQLSLRAHVDGPASHRLSVSLADPSLRPVEIVRPKAAGAPDTDMPLASGAMGEASCSIGDAGATTGLTMRYPVNPRSEFAAEEAMHSSSLSGDYLVALRIDPIQAASAPGASHAVRLSWQATGQELGAAPEVEGTGVPPSYLGLELGQWVRIGGLGGGAAFLLVAAGLGVLAVRRRRGHQLDSPRPPAR